MNINDKTQLEEHWTRINQHRHKRGRGFLKVSAADRLFQKICDRFFSDTPGRSIFEIGCAPGKKLLRFAERYHGIPYGVEYTKEGADKARVVLSEFGVPADNVFFSDVFDVQFKKEHHEQFDVVMSFGFIEHFEDVNMVIDTHVHFLKKGGTLLIVIPNLRGIYFPLMKFFDPDLLDIHNLSIMSKSTYQALFVDKGITPLFCGYYGVLNFGMLQTNTSRKRLVLRLLQLAQALLTPLLVRCHRFENSYTSPYLLYIGKKM